MTVICDINYGILSPAKEEVSKSRAHDDGQTQPGVEGHGYQHQHVCQRDL